MIKIQVIMSIKLTKETFSERYLKEGVSYCGRFRLYLLEFGIKKNKCEICGRHTWQGRPLVCQIHHINGNRNDNRLENLQMLCPNCHSQTDNFQTKNTFIYNPKDKICKNCGKTFKAKYDDQRYCSSKCRYEYELKHPRKIEVPYTKEYMEELCKKYNSLEEMGVAINKSKEAVKRYLILHNLFKKYKFNKDFYNKPIIQYNLDGDFIKEWSSIRDASETLQIQHIPAVCKGIRKSAGGYLWRYKESDDFPQKISVPSKFDTSKKEIIQYDLNENYIQEFSSISDAARITGVSREGIHLCLNGTFPQMNGYIWKYKQSIN